MSQPPSASVIALAAPLAPTSVAAAEMPVAIEFAKAAQAEFGAFHHQSGGDHALCRNRSLNELPPTAHSAPDPDFVPLDGAIGDAVRFAAAEAEMSLPDDIARPTHRAPGMMTHRDKAAPEDRPGSTPTDRHVCMRPGKPAVGPVMAMPAEKIDDATWAEPVRRRVRGKIGARQDDRHRPAPDGDAFGLGPISTTLEDLGRFGVIFTPGRTGAKDSGQAEDFGDAPFNTSVPRDDGALWKHGKFGQGFYISSARDVGGVHDSTDGRIPPFGADEAPGFLHRAAKTLAA